MEYTSLFSPIEKTLKFIYGLFKRKPVFTIALDNKELKKETALTVGIWVKNTSINPHDIVRIEGELAGYPNRLRIAIVDNKYRLPIRLNPNDPERIIVFICEFIDKNSLPASQWNIKIKIYSRWEGKEAEAGRLEFTLK